MLIKIQGLPFKSKYQDVKVLVRSECTITDFKLDNLVVDNDCTKKVLVTVGNEAEAFCLIKCLNGYRMSNNCVLSVESMSTQKSTELNPSPQNTFEQRPGSNYQQPRSDYPNQMANEYNRGPHSYGQSGPHMPQRPVEAIGTRNEGWNSANGPGNQWSHNQSANPQGSQSSGFPGTPIYPQHPSMPQRVESYTGNRPQQSANYGYPLKNNIPNAGNHQSSRQDIRSNDMRNTDATLTHGPTGRYPPSFQQEKPITIMKDNFQGPTMYQLGSNSGTYQGPAHGAPQIWNQGQEPKNQGYAKSNPLPYEKYDDDRRHPQSDKRAEIKGSQEGMRMTAYKNYEKSRQFSPTRRNLPGRGSPPMKKRVPSPHAASTREMLARRLGSPERKISPMGVAMSGRLSPPIRNMSPPIRRVSPSGRWVSATRPVSPPGRRVSPSGRRGSPTGRRVSPTGRRVSPPGRRVSPPGRRGSPSERRISPSSRRMSPLGGRVVAPNIRVSPSGRRPVSLERPSLSGRRISPSRMASRHISPPGRRVSPSERRMSPSDSRMLNRRVSPRRPTAQKRGSPDRRLESPPPRAGSRQAPRYSPRHHIDDKVMEPKMDINVHKSKQVRPAYESQASSQAMYSGGYRQNLKENISYPISGTRQPEQRSSPWHQVRDKNTYVPLKKQEDDRRDLNEKRHPRQSHSPVHRERSPIRDNYRTSSPVSRSPRRSWALEKRPYCRSPEAAVPPPPTWPGNKPRDEDLYKNKFNRPEDIPKHPLVWERPPVKMENPKRLEEPRGSEDKLRGRGIPQRDMGPTPYDQNQREPKFNPRHEFDDNHKEEYQRQRDMLRRSPDRREFREAHPRAHEERRHDEFRRLPSPRREEPKKPEFQEFDKDFEDIYKRAQEFRKKAEQLRRPDERRRDEHVPENHHESHRDDKYDSRRERSPHRRPELDHHEPERRYDESKYKDSELRDRESDWKEKKPLEKAKKFMLLPHVKTKRDKATDDILGKIMRKYKQIIDLTEDQRNRVAEELKLALARLLLDMFGENDVSFIEMVIKYDAKISGKQEEAMVHDVLKCLPSLYRRGKRSVPESEGLSKMARYSPESAMKGGKRPRWSPIKPNPQWEAKVEIQHREIVDNRPKYEHPKEQRPKFTYKSRIDTRPMERHPPGPKLKYEQHLLESQPQLRPKVRPRVVEVKPKIITPTKTKTKMVPKVSPRIKEPDEKSTNNAEAVKDIAVQGPPLDEPGVETSAPGGYYELSPLMSRMLETELQDIMIKVWQELPDNPTNEAEKLVVNKLRNKAGDDLRNVFGLNVSQRLLNVFNLLYIKMKFTSNPEGQELTKFLVKNSITNFKWNNVKPLTYNAVVKNVKDFDRLCATQTYTIGNVKVAISPLYQFTKCPLKLRTSYHIDNATSKSVAKEEVNDQTNPTEVTETKPKEPSSEDNETKSEDTKAIKGSQEKVVEKPPAVIKETAKPEAVQKETPKEATKVPTTVSNDTKKVQKPTKQTIIKKVVKKPVGKKIVKKEPLKAVDKKPKQSCKNILQAGDDYDELNDDEIMTLVSQGIILDQCSGSDED